MVLHSLGTSHIQNPFLLRSYVQELYQYAFSDNVAGQKEGSNGSYLSQHQLFRTFMILAIGSIPLYRTGKHRHHPYGYFLSAMKHLEVEFLSKGLDSIQDLLLVSRFGIYHHIGRTPPSPQSQVPELKSNALRHIHMGINSIEY